MSDVFDLLTKFPVLIGIIIGTFSTVIGSILALITTIITNRSQRHREREQWTREKVQEIYSNSIASLTILSANHSLLSLLSKEFANALKWLNILLIYQPEKYKEEFVTLPEEVNLFSSQDWKRLAEKYKNLKLYSDIDIVGQADALIAVKGLLTRIIKLASVDKRLHG